jgi:DNA-binding MarR family transcriptional regulator
MRWQDATQAFDEAVGEKLDLNAAERRCLAFVFDGPQPAGALAQTVALTPAAITSLVDRLEKKGFLKRTRDEKDRRKVMVAATKKGRKEGWRYYGPLAEDGSRLLAKLDASQLQAVAFFLEEVLALQIRHLAALKGERRSPPEEK